MKASSFLGTFLLSILFIACDTPRNESQDESDEQNDVRVDQLNNAELLVQNMELAHEKEKFMNSEVIQFDLDLKFSGNQRFLGTVYTTPDGGKVKLVDSVKTMVWDGKEAYLAPDTSSYSGARFDLLTWSYFFIAPYKFSDSGTIYSYLGEKNLNHKEYLSLKLDFEEGVGDTPDDWYIIYQDIETDLLAALAYVVTYGKSEAKANEDPHAITYEAYEKVNGIPFASRWNFWTWNNAGELGKLLGEAEITNIKFIKKADDLFQPASNSRIAQKPEA